VRNVRQPCAYFPAVFACEATFPDGVRTVILRLFVARGADDGFVRWQLERYFMGDPDGALSPAYMHILAGEAVVGMLNLIASNGERPPVEGLYHDDGAALGDCIRDCLSAFYTLPTTQRFRLYLTIIPVAVKSFVQLLLPLCHNILAVAGLREQRSVMEGVHIFVCVLHLRDRSMAARVVVDNGAHRLTVLSLSMADYDRLVNLDFEGQRSRTPTPPMQG